MKKRIKKLLIVGAGTAGNNILQEIKENPELGLEVVGFIDDNPFVQSISDIKILGTKRDFKKIVKKNKIDEVLIALPSAKGQKISEYIKLCVGTKVSFKIVPRVKEIIEGKAHLTSVRKVKIDDLLGRPVIKSDVKELKDFFKEATILITGAAGSIGSELSRQITAYRPKKIILLDLWENGIFQLQQELQKDFSDVKIKYFIGNIQDKKKINEVFGSLKPNLVFHAAAYKHVPLMEENPGEAVKNNIFGTLNTAYAAIKSGAERFVLVSTDKAARPVSIMGATKLISEGIVKTLNGKTKFMTVRFGNVLDSYGSILPTFRKQISEGGPVTITHQKMKRYFMTIPEATQLILKASFLGNGGELFVFDMGEQIKIEDLAKDFIRLHGLEPNKDIKIIYTGIRKGEKIREKLFMRKEKIKATKKKRIYITESLGINVKQIPTFIKRLNILVKNEDFQGIKQEFRKIIKNFPLT